MDDPADVPQRANAAPPPDMPAVKQLPPEDVINGLPSKEEVVDTVQSVDEIVRGQPTVDELLRRGR
jgi:hypothetical protein